MSEKIRITYSVLDNLKFISHADTTRLLFRLFRMVELPLKFSEGFSPHPLASFSVPRAVGMASRCELIDVTLTEKIDLMTVMVQLNECAPAGLSFIKMDTIDKKVTKLSDFSHATYNVYLPDDLSCSNEAIDTFLAQEEIVVKKRKKGMMVDFNIRPYIFALSVDEENKKVLTMDLKVAQNSVSPVLLLEKLFPSYEDVPGLLVVRESLLV